MYFKFVIIVTFHFCVAQNGLKKCACVANNKCFPNLILGGELDIRIVNENTTPGTTAPPTSPCSSGLIQCCSECGITYNITTAPAPGSGQGRYGAQPWQTVIFDSDFNYLGGGALIDEYHVLTAAHKVYEFRNTPDEVIVRLGEWSTASDNEPYKSQDADVTKIVIHAQYSDTAKNLFNDVAVLKLAKAIQYGPTINPAINTACLPTAATKFDGLKCIVSGWGKNAFHGSYQTIIKEVEVPVVDNSRCETILKTTRLGPQYILDTNSFMCAGGESGKDACVGDGGSPLMCKIGEKYYVAGLVAWGIGCGNATIPGVYVRIQSYLDFINNATATK